MEKGARAEVIKTVTAEMTADYIGSGTLPVFATPCMISMMENAAMKAAAPFLESKSTTVGTSMNVRHISATPVGMNVRAEAVLESVDGRKLIFSVSAYDEAGLIGNGTHERYVVYSGNFTDKAYSKISGSEV